MRIEGNDFEKNLPGRWEGNWQVSRFSGPVRIKISKIEGNLVQLTGFLDTGDFGWSDDVYGRIENSILILNWPAFSETDRYEMKIDESNNLLLHGSYRSPQYSGTKRLKKIE